MCDLKCHFKLSDVHATDVKKTSVNKYKNIKSCYSVKFKKKHTKNRNKENISIVYTIVSNILTLFRNTC